MKKNVKIFQNEKMGVEMKMHKFYFQVLESAPIKEYPVRIENLCTLSDISQQDEKRSCQTDINRFQKVTEIKGFSKVETIKNPMNHQYNCIGQITKLLYFLNAEIGIRPGKVNGALSNQPGFFEAIHLRQFLVQAAITTVVNHKIEHLQKCKD
jgi:hypothetical protein